METACTVCTWSPPLTELSAVQPSPFLLWLLQNDCLPAQLLPTSYNTDVYLQAILCPEGMTSFNSLAMLHACICCHNTLCRHPPHQPKGALANFLYYRVN